jgi:hypothetical protein
MNKLIQSRMSTFSEAREGARPLSKKQISKLRDAINRQIPRAWYSKVYTHKWKDGTIRIKLYPLRDPYVNSAKEARRLHFALTREGYIVDVEVRVNWRNQRSLSVICYGD